MLLSVTTRILNVQASPVTIGVPRHPLFENQPQLIFSCVSVNRLCVRLCPVCLTPGSAKIPPILSLLGSPLTYHPAVPLLHHPHCNFHRIILSLRNLNENMNSMKVDEKKTGWRHSLTCILVEPSLMFCICVSDSLPNDGNRWSLVKCCYLCLLP